MVGASKQWWESLEQWRSTAFLVGGGMFLVSAAITGYDVVTEEALRMLLGQAILGVGWTAGLVGLLGLYPGLAERSHWLTLAGAVTAAIGVVGYIIMSTAALAIFSGLIATDFEALAPAFLPFAAIGTLLAFPLFGAASLRSNVHSRTVGILLVIPTLVFVTNVLTPSPAEVVFVILTALLLVWFALGYLLRRETIAADHEDVEPSGTPSAR